MKTRRLQASQEGFRAFLAILSPLEEMTEITFRNRCDNYQLEHGGSVSFSSSQSHLLALFHPSRAQAIWSTAGYLAYASDPGF